MHDLYKYKPQEIVVIGHSVAGIDIPYFKRIDELTGRSSNRVVYYFNNEERDIMQKALGEQGISQKRIKLFYYADFYDLKSKESI